VRPASKRCDARTCVCASGVMWFFRAALVLRRYEYIYKVSIGAPCVSAARALSPPVDEQAPPRCEDEGEKGGLGA